jgi:hypothetical protein
MKRGSTILAAAVALVALAGPASAQMTGNPVYATTYGTGVTIAPEYARCTSNCGPGNPSVLGARVILGLPVIQIGAGIGIYNPDVTSAGGIDADKETTFEASAGLQVFGGPLIPVSVRVQTGIGVLKTGSPTDPVLGGEFKNFTVPIALGISVDIPTPGFNLEPWAAPRIQISHESFETGAIAAVTGTNIDVGFSVGVNGGLPMGLGFHAALDFLRDKALGGLAGAVDQSVVTFGIGVHYTFRLPNAPMVPGV